MTKSNGHVSTATVEALTAEVRVLMVGSRQITLSVAKQLDRVCYDEMEPLGRVRSGRRDDYPRSNECNTEIIGRHRVTGSLVFGFAPQPYYTSPPSWRHWMFHVLGSGVEPAELWPVAMTPSRHIMDFTIIDSDGCKLIWTVENTGHCPCPSKERNPFRPYDTDREKHDEWDRQYRFGHFCGGLSALEEIWAPIAQTQHRDVVRATKLQAEAKELPLIVLAGLK